MHMIKALLVAAIATLASTPAFSQSAPFNAYSISTLGGNCSNAAAVPYQNTSGLTQCSNAGTPGQVFYLDPGGVPGWTTLAGSGSVTSVGLSLPSIFTVTGSPVTAAGTLTGTLASQAANTFFAAPDSIGGVPTFRSMLAADMPFDQAKAGAVTVGSTTTGIGVNLNANGATRWVVNDAGRFYPAVDNTYELGSSATRVKRGWFGNDLDISGAAGSTRNLYLKTDNSIRWHIRADNAAESGGNAGSNFQIYRYDDSGASLGTIMSATRATGAVNFAGAVSMGSLTLPASITGTLPVANGGTGTASPALTAGRLTSITGTWPNNTIASTESAKEPQEYGADPTGVADSTTAISNWLNAGGLLNCEGRFLITGTVTANYGQYGGVNLVGAGRQKCQFVLNGANARIVLNSNYAPDQVSAPQIIVRDIGFRPISDVTGCALTVSETATTSSGKVDPTTVLENISITPGTSTGAPTCGIDLNGVRSSNVSGIHIVGERAGTVAGSVGIKLRGDYDPVENNLTDINIYYMDTAIELSGTWQGVTLDKVATLNGRYGVTATTTNGNSEWLRITNSHFNVSDWGIKTDGVWNTHFTDNYILFGNNNPNAGTVSTVGIHQIMTANTTAKWFVQNNQIAASARTGVTTKYGMIYDGVVTGVTSATIGTNILEGLTIGTQLDAGTNGLLLYPQRTIGVTTPLVNNATASANSQVTSSAL